MLKELLYPKSIAIIGASQNPGKVGYGLVANLVQGGFKGHIVPVSLTATKILEQKCYKTLVEYKGKIDLGLVAVPVKAVKEAVESCVDAGAKAVIVITAGFKEVGAEGLKLERELVEYAKASDLRLLGPNCIGVLNTHHQMNATFAPAMPPPGRISVISQSGALCVAILDWAATEKIGMGKVISLGNKAELNEVDFLEALAEDKETAVIVGYLENIVDGARFLQVAEQTAGQKPVLILKAGTTKAGAKAASSHTGSLAGADVAYTAAFKHSGVIRAESFERLFDYALAFGTQPLPAGNRVTIITNAGGPGIMAADASEANGLELLPPTDAARAKLKEFLPTTAAFGNPIDVIGDADPARYIKALEVLQDDPNTDAILVLVTPQNMTAPLELAQALEKAHKKKKPLLTAFMGGSAIAGAKEYLTSVGIPNYPSPERAVLSLKAMCDYAAWRKRPTRVVLRFPVNRRRVDRLIARYVRMQNKQVSEVEAKEILAAYGFRTLPGSLATDREESVEVAERIGYPVVMKVVSPSIIHKSDLGGVLINLGSADQVRDAYDLIVTRSKRFAPKAVLRGVYVEKMGRRGREVILGLTRDPQFGPMLMFGLGGIFVEVLKDVAFHLAPVTADEAMQMLKLTRSYSLLMGARGQKPVDLAAIANAIQRISQLATDYPQIAELDINPFIVGEVGTEAYAADARITLNFPENFEPSHE
ncbi:MAG: acetate--CoA ligase family protein [Verrucomicrobia bacterium]|nr:acetate--CoA ligase family protein [Verrucomicrobiota bacterium]